LDSFTWFKNKAHQYHLLSPEEEIEIGKLLKHGNRQEKEFAKKTFLEKNLPLVFFVAKRFRCDFLEPIDIIQEGNIGLIRAIKKFDIDKGFRFSTYAIWWIRQSISRTISTKNGMVRLPAHIAEIRTKAKLFIEEYWCTHASEPDDQLVANYIGYTLDKYKKDIASTFDYVSIDTPILGGHDDIEAILLDVIPGSDLNKEIENNLATIEIEKILKYLNKREEHIIIRRFGLFGFPQMKLEDVGKTLNITRERVRQIEKAALKKMQSHPLAHSLFYSY
jgi:RNA polymerase primary sigma factor